MGVLSGRRGDRRRGGEEKDEHRVNMRRGNKEGAKPPIRGVLTVGKKARMRGMKEQVKKGVGGKKE